MPFIPQNEQLAALIKQMLGGPTVGDAFDTTLKLRQQEQENALSVFKSLAATNPGLAEFLLGQPGVAGALTKTPPMIPKRGAPSPGEVVGEAAAGYKPAPNLDEAAKLKRQRSEDFLEATKAGLLLPGTTEENFNKAVDAGRVDAVVRTSTDDKSKDTEAMRNIQAVLDAGLRGEVTLPDGKPIRTIGDAMKFYWGDPAGKIAALELRAAKAEQDFESARKKFEVLGVQTVEERRTALEKRDALGGKIADAKAELSGLITQRGTFGLMAMGDPKVEKELEKANEDAIKAAQKRIDDLEKSYAYAEEMIFAAPDAPAEGGGTEPAPKKPTAKVEKAPSTADLTVEEKSLLADLRKVMGDEFADKVDDLPPADQKKVVERYRARKAKERR